MPPTLYKIHLLPIQLQEINTSTKEQTKKKIQLMSQLQQLLNSITIKIGVVSYRDPDIETNLHN
jgi:hypothetical protein